MITDEHKIVACPGCGERVWEPRLEQEGCPFCRALNARRASTLGG